jgi:hypothetical protein
MSGDNDTYEALRIEDINGQEVVNINGMSRYTTVKTFRRLVATRIRRSPEDVRLMAFGRLMDDDSTLGDCGVEEDTIISRIVTSLPADTIPHNKVALIRPNANAASDHPSRLREKYEGRQLKNVFVKKLDGKSLTVHDIPLQMTVKDFVKYVAYEKGMDVGNVRLLFGGKEMNTESTLIVMDYGLMDGSELILVYRLPGGGCL